MASRNLGTLTLDLILKLGGFSAGMDKAERRTAEFERKLRSASKAINAAFVAGLSVAATSISYAVKQSIDHMDELSKAAQKIGLPTEELSRLAYAADLSDVSLEQLQGGLAKLTKFQAEAAQGGKDAVKTFEAFGIAIKDNEGHLRATELVLRDFAAVFKALPDGPEKTALALRVFGKSGAELIPLLNSGADGLREMADEADKFGVTISTQAGKQAEEFNDNVTRLQTQLKGFATDVAQKVLPELIHLTEALRGAGQEAEGFNFGDLVANEMASASKAIRGTAVEIEFLKKAWKEQGLFGEGILSVLTKADAEFQRRENLAGALDIHGGPGGRGTARKGAAQGAQDVLDRQAAEAAKKLLATTQDTTKATKGKSDADKAAEEAAKRHAEALEDLREKLEDVAEANKQFKIELEDLEAQQSGPQAEAALKYKRDLADLKKLAGEGEVSTTDLAKAEALLGAEYAKTTAEIAKRLDTGGQQLEQMQQELDLLNMQTEAERVRAQFLLDNPTASDAQADAAARISAQIDETRQLIGNMDQLRDANSDMWQEIADGSASGIDALKNFANAFAQMLQKMAADYLSSALFGQQGTTGGGLFGNLFSSIFGSFGGSSSAISSSGFGDPALDLSAWTAAGYAQGTDNHPGGWSWVGEEGPELQYVPRGAQIYPADESRSMALGGSGLTINNHYGLPTDPRTRSQIAADQARVQRRAQNRNGVRA